MFRFTDYVSGWPRVLQTRPNDRLYIGMDFFAYRPLIFDLICIYGLAHAYATIRRHASELV